MTTNKRPGEIRAAWLRASASVLLVAALSTGGCTPVNRLREAQDAFNQGAAAENTQRLTPGSATDMLTSLTSVRASYASALQSLDKLSDAEETSLKNDKLWGAALTLKALCQWRLGEFDNALATVQEAQKTQEQIYPRDQALQLALPGLIKTDQAYDKIARKSASFAVVKDLLVGSQGAVSDLTQARASVDKEHPVQVYLIQSQLAAFRNFIVARVELVPNNEPVASPHAVLAQQQLDELNELLKKLSTEDAQRQALVQYWAKLCGLSPSP
jgi:tetratricopeptide (TPR) repeat protein